MQNQKLKFYIKIFIFLYVYLAFVWNWTRTYDPDPRIRKIKIDTIESVKYSAPLQSFNGKFNRKIITNDPDINLIYFKSEKLKKSYLLNSGKTVWVELVCIGANSWLDLFTFERKFNYKICHVLNQNDKSLDQDSLIWTFSMYACLIVHALVLPSILFRSLSKKSKKVNSTEIKS
jgi:hypothetical protein